tara:strand:+ start:1007 stop:1306 length:300 start_codon:yes stop_codon:yes gene_type:complete
MTGVANLILGLFIGGFIGVLVTSLGASASYDKGYKDAWRRNNCWYCGGELIWGGDFDYEDYCREGEGIVSNLSCQKCNAYVEYSIGEDNQVSKEEPVKN